MKCGSLDMGTKSTCRRHQELSKLAGARQRALRPQKIRVLLAPDERRRRRAATKLRCEQRARQRWRESGLCPRCGDIPLEGFVQCERCNARSSRWDGAKLRRTRRESGLCIDCGAQATEGRQTCSPCRDKDREDRRIANAKIAEAGLCQRCRVDKASIGVFCEECWYKGRAQGSLGSSARWQELKALLIAQGFRCAYSGKLLILGPDATIDHKIPRSRGGTNDIWNLHWVSRRVNTMKTDFTHEEFIRACEIIAKRWQKKPNQRHIESAPRSMRLSAI